MMQGGGGVVSDNIVVKLSELQVEERFEKFGGVICPQVFANFHEMLEVAINNTTCDDLSDYLDSPDGARPKSQFASLLVHRVPMSDENRKSYKVVIASNYIGSRLVQQFDPSSRLRLLHRCRSCQGLFGWGSLRGIVFEHFAHERLMAGGKFKLLPVGTVQNPVIGASLIEVDFPQMTLPGQIERFVESRRFQDERPGVNWPCQLEQHLQI